MPVAPDPPPSRPVTLICHLLAAPAAAGEVIGYVEVVATGDVVSIASLTDLLALLHRVAIEMDAPPAR